jgi:DNA polymerase III delta prime subunit
VRGDDTRSALMSGLRRRRVVIINDAEALVEAAQNALLKTLEEMPTASIFLLVSPRPMRSCRPCDRDARA